MRAATADMLLLLTAILWGLGYIGVDILVADKMSSLAIVGMRFLIATIILGIIFYKKLQINKKAIEGSIVVGTILFLAFMFQTLAVSYTTITNVSFLTSANIVFVPLLSFVILKKPIKIKHIISIAITMIGIWILTGGINSINKGDILTLLCAFFFGFHMVMISYYSKSVEIYTLAIGQMLITSLLAFIVMFISRVDVVYEVSHSSILVLLFVGAIPSALCFLLQNIGLKNTDESRGSIILSTESLWGVIFAVILLGETLTVTILIGGFLMFFAIFIDEIKIERYRAIRDKIKLK